MMLPQLEIHTTPDDIKYILFSQSEVISDQIRSTGFWNEHVIKIAENILNKKTDGIVLDVGAGIGSFTVPLAIKFQNLKFLTFEPLKVIFWQLCANVLLNNLYNVRTFYRIVSDQIGTLKYYDLDYANSSNHGSISFNEKINGIRGISFENCPECIYSSITIDDYKFEKIALIKISAAGLEKNVLIGAENSIRKCSNPPIILELWDESFYENEKNQCLEILKSFGYECVNRVGNHVIAFKNNDEYLLHSDNVIRVGEFGGFTVFDNPVNIKDAVEDQAINDSN